MDLSTLYLIFLALTFFFSGSWRGLAQLPVLFQLLLLGLVGWLGYCKKKHPLTKPAALPRPGLKQFVIVLAILAPLLVYGVFVLSQEFPFIGDAGAHFNGARNLGRELPREVWLLLPPALLFWFSRKTRWAAALALLALLASEAWRGPSPFFYRYPNSTYLLTLPLHTLSRLFVPGGSLLANNLTNVLSAIAWLLVLRPLLLRRWPDERAVLLGAFLFWQKDIVYYFASAYLEPWALVLLALAVESLLDEQLPVWLPVLLVGASAIFKETTIVCLPFFWWAAHARRGKQPWFLPAAWPLLLVAVVPFSVLYSLQKIASQMRPKRFSLSFLNHLPSLFHEYAYRLHLQLGASGLVALVATLCLGIYLLTIRRERLTVLAFAAAAFVQELLFALDEISRFWTGYPRFHLVSQFLLGGLLLAFARARLNQRYVYALAILLAVLNLPPLVGFLRVASGPSEGLNYFEHYDSPLFVPVKSLFGKAAKIPGFPNIVKVELYTPQYLNLWLSYRSIHDRFQWQESGTELSLCECRDAESAIFWVGDYRPGPLAPTIPAPAAPSAQCQRQLEGSCQTVLRQEVDGQLTGLLAFGHR